MHLLQDPQGYLVLDVAAVSVVVVSVAAAVVSVAVVVVGVAMRRFVAALV